MHRLTPSMPANLVQNLDQQTYDSNRTPKPPAKVPVDTYSGTTAQGPPQLPPLDMQRVQSDSSSQYSGQSALDEYLKGDTFSKGQQPSQRGDAYSYNAPPPVAQQTTGRQDPYSTYNAQASTTQQGRNDPYGNYNAQQIYPHAPPQPPYVDQARPNSRPGSSQDKPLPQQQAYPPPPQEAAYAPPLPPPQQQQGYPPPPQQVDYSGRPSSSGYQSQSYSTTDHQRKSSNPPKDQYTYPPAAPPRSSGGGRPYSQDLSNRTPKPYDQNRTSAYQPSYNQDFIDMPDPPSPSHLSPSD